MRSPDDGEGHLVSLFPKGFGSPEIDKVHVPYNVRMVVTFIVDHDIFGFEIAINDLLLMEVLEAEDHCGDVELCIVALQESDLPNHVEEFQASNVLH